MNDPLYLSDYQIAEVEAIVDKRVAMRMEYLIDRLDEFLNEELSKANEEIGKVLRRHLNK